MPISSWSDTVESGTSYLQQNSTILLSNDERMLHAFYGLFLGNLFVEGSDVIISICVISNLQIENVMVLRDIENYTGIALNKMVK